MKRPSFQFYPGDHLASPNIGRCTNAELGIWLTTMCLLHNQDEYGIVRWTLKELARAVHATPSALQGLIDKGVLKGADQGATCAEFVFVPRHGGQDGQPVVLIPSQAGPIWYSSRMVKDEHVRTVRATTQGSPKAPPKGGIGETIGGHPTPHLSRAGASSSSSSSEVFLPDPELLDSGVKNNSPEVSRPVVTNSEISPFEQREPSYDVALNSVRSNDRGSGPDRSGADLLFAVTCLRWDPPLTRARTKELLVVNSEKAATRKVHAGDRYIEGILDAAELEVSRDLVLSDTPF